MSAVREAIDGTNPLLLAVTTVAVVAAIICHCRDRRRPLYHPDDPCGETCCWCYHEGGE